MTSNHIRHRIARRARVVVGALLSAGALLITVPAASADFGLQPGADGFDGLYLAEPGEAATQAGSHPFSASVKFELNAATDAFGNVLPDGGSLKDAVVHLPVGIVGNPQVVPECPLIDFFVTNDLGIPDCADETAVGVIELNISFGPFTFPVPVPLYNLEPQNPEVTAQFGTSLLTVPIVLFAAVRSGDDYGLDVAIRNASQGLQILGANTTFWGVPADSAHDAQRGSCLAIGGSCSVSTPERPMLRMPTSCSPTLGTSIEVRSWSDPGTTIERSFIHHDLADPPNPVAITGCERLSFDPTAVVVPGNQAADSPTGLRVEIEVPQNEVVVGLGESDLRDVTIEFPEGMAVNPSAADGLDACEPEEIALASDAPAACPAASKIGDVTLTTPLLAEQLKGSVYLASQGTNPFNSLLALYLVAEGQGVVIKLAGEVSPDPDTGRLTATFEDNPQLPFSQLEVRLKGGQRAPLVTPPTCGEYAIQTELVPWARPGDTEIRTSTFTIDQGPDGGSCLAGDPSQPGDPADLADRPFGPEMKAGVKNPVAGSFTPFTFQLKRPDGHQEILSTEVTPPAGVTARLAGIPFCDEADAQVGACGPESLVGTAITGAGAGTHPFYIQNGSVYLAGPYDPDGPGGDAEEAPLSLVISVPAVAGPLDLGVVNVRAAVYVDPTTAQLRVVSDPIPQILEGIPLRVRDIRIRMNRDHFTIAPTDCEEMQVKATAYGSHGAEADLQNRFQVGECASLGFEPKLRFKAAGGKKATKRNAHPGLRANLKVPGADAYAEGASRGSQANIRRVAVTLPRGLFLDQASPALADPCTRTEYEDGECPANSKVGRAVAHTPLLDEPLSGPVYLRTGDNPLPDLVADLDGIVDIDLVGAISQHKQRIRNTFRIVPDVPVSAFELRIKGGSAGMLVNSNVGKGLCGRKRRQINVAMRAHNERRHAYKTQMKARCGKGKAKRRAKRRG